MNVIGKGMPRRGGFGPAQRGYNYRREPAPIAPTLMGPCVEDAQGTPHLLVSTNYEALVAYCGYKPLEVTQVSPVVATVPERVCEACKMALAARPKQ